MVPGAAGGQLYAGGHRHARQHRAECALGSPMTIDYANAYVVNTTQDVVAADGLLSLREAVLAANANAAVGDAQAGSAVNMDVITFAPSLTGKTITLSGFDLPVTDNLAVVGPGQTLLTVDGNSQTDVFNVSAGVQAVFSDLTVSHGANSAIRNAGTATLERVTVSNSAGVGYGGGIYNTGTLTVDASMISGNIANWGGSSANGGGVYNSGA